MNPISTSHEPASDSSRAAHLAAFQHLQQTGQMHDAAAHLARALDLRAYVALPFRGSVPMARVLVLQSILAGNVLMHRFLDDRLFQVHVLLVEFWQPETPLPEHDLVFNAIGDADVRQEALAQAALILQGTAAPVFNPPSSVRSTSRAHNADRLQRLHGVRTAKTVRVNRSEMVSDALPETLDRHLLGFPLLVRAPGFHMGQNCLLVESNEQLPGVLEQLPGDELLLLEYMNARNADGWCRKFRVLFLDGQLYPVHLAVSSHWKVHYFSAEMADSAAHRAEDAHFLQDMDSVLGASAIAALQRIQRVLALDYGGIDFSLDAEGRILLFEANANMAVIRPASDSIWDYRRPAVERIYEAFQQMLIERIRSSPASLADLTTGKTRTQSPSRTLSV